MLVSGVSFMDVRQQEVSLRDFPPPPLTFACN